MASRCDFFGLENTAIEELAREILIRICGHFAIRRQESRLRAKHQLVPAVPLRRQFTQCLANGPFAALETIIYRRIDYVNAPFHRRNHRLRVTVVCPGVGLAEISSDTDGRKHLPARNFAKVPWRRAPLEPGRVSKCSLCCS